MSFTIHTNAPADQFIYLEGAFGAEVEFEGTETFRCQVRSRPGATVVLTFETDGNTGTIEIETVTITNADGDEETRDALHFYAAQSLVANLKPGLYVADLLRTDEAAWELGFPVIVEAGVTTP